jgi:hypothetical protein
MTSPSFKRSITDRPFYPKASIGVAVDGTIPKLLIDGGDKKKVWKPVTSGLRNALERADRESTTTSICFPCVGDNLGSGFNLKASYLKLVSPMHDEMVRRENFVPFVSCRVQLPHRTTFYARRFVGYLKFGSIVRWCLDRTSFRNAVTVHCVFSARRISQDDAIALQTPIELFRDIPPAIWARQTRHDFDWPKNGENHD